MRAHPGSTPTTPAKDRMTRSTLAHLRRLALAIAMGAAAGAHAQLPVQPAANQEALLASADPALAANKKLVFDFWREILEGGHLELTDKYLAEGYIQHNPNVPTGRAAFVDFFKRFAKPRDIQPRIAAPLVSVVAERDLVILSFVQPTKDPKDASRTATTTWFDMFRIENGRIAEHWDCAPRQ
jgi:predicted SnoaL-like aldol condensation-catalyzing enzyme